MNKMAVQHKNIYLFLALACFVGIILIFVFDGYIGLYDTLTLSTGEQTQKIELQQWIDQTRFSYPAQFYTANVGVLSFSYEVGNRRFASYQADLNVSIWENQQKVADVLSKKINVKAFGQDTIQWTVDTGKIVTGNTTVNNDFTLQINLGDIERKVIITIAPGINGLKTIVVPTPQAP